MAKIIKQINLATKRKRKNFFFAMIDNSLPSYMFIILQHESVLCTYLHGVIENLIK